MPNDATNAALVTSAGNNISTAGNIAASATMNKATRKWNEQQRDIQRGWALADWNAQNEYNSPKAQRERMIAAGMNPALMYGAASGGGVSAPIRTTQTPQWSPQAPDVSGVGRGISQGLEAFYDIRMKEATLKQMEIQNELLQEKIGTQKAQTSLTWNKAALTEGENTKLQGWLTAVQAYADTPVHQSQVDSGQYKSLDTKRNYYGETQWLEIQNSWQRYSNAFDQNERQEVLNAANVDVLVARLSEIAQRNAESQSRQEQIRANTELLQKSGILKQINIDGQQFLNSRFDAPALKILLGLLQKADVIR